jgi:hypothetical protein
MANDFLVFGGAAGANVINQVSYSGLAARTAGFSSGVAQSAQLNKVWRQSSIMASVLAQFISDQTGQDAVDDGTITTLLANLKAASLAMHGQCRLVKSGANLLLQPYNGNRLIIGGIPRVVPAAGISLAPTGLTPNTLYYVYAYMNGAAMALEASTTGHSTDATTGVEIRTGDASRTLVGMAYVSTGTAFADNYQQRHVASWFNRRTILGAGNFTTGRSTSSNTPTELNAEIRNSFVCWGDEGVVINAYGIVTLAGSPGQQASTGIAVDSTSVLYDASIQYQRDTNSNIGTATIGTSALLSEGFHFATLLGYVSASNATWSANNFLKTQIRG